MCRTQQKSQSVKSVTYLQNTNPPSSPASSLTGAFCPWGPQKVLLNGSHESICSIYYLNAQGIFPAVYTFLLQQSGLIKSISVSSQTLKTRQGRDCWSCSALSTQTPLRKKGETTIFTTLTPMLMPGFSFYPQIHRFVVLQRCLWKYTSWPSLMTGAFKDTGLR